MGKLPSGHGTGPVKYFFDPGQGEGNVFRLGIPIGFVFRVPVVPERAAGQIEGDGEVGGVLIFDQIHDRAHETRDGAGVPAFGVDEWTGDECVVCPVNEGVPVEKE